MNVCVYSTTAMVLLGLSFHLHRAPVLTQRAAGEKNIIKETNKRKPKEKKKPNLMTKFKEWLEYIQ